MIDVDKLFENYFRSYLIKNQGKFSEEQLENKVGEVYDEFGNSPLKELGGKSPRAYFSELSDCDLVALLKECVEKSVSVSDFLCEELERRDGVFDYLVKLVNANESDELATYAVNFIRYGKEVEKACPAFANLLLSGECGDSLAETLTEVLCEHADEVAQILVEGFENSSQKIRAYVTEIFSNASHRNEIFEILKEEFKANPKDIALYAGYFAKYGDDRAVEIMNDVISRGGLNYVDYKELKMAIESLGGEVIQIKDYSTDPTYKKLH